MKHFLRITRVLLVATLSISGLSVFSQTKTVPAKQSGPSARTVRLDFKDLKLKNGLRAIIAEDHTAPVISLAMTYNVG